MTPNAQRMHAASKGTHVALAQPEDFATAITRCAVMIGQAVPRPEAIAIMHGVITDLFMWVTIEDLELAVKLNFTGNLPSKTEPYGEFSMAYLSAILKAYEPERGKAVAYYRSIEERMDTSHQLAPPVVTDEQWRQMMTEDVRRKKTGTTMWRYCATRMVKWLEDTGQLSDDTFTTDEWRRFNAKARAAVMERRGIGSKAVERMAATERARFDQECLDEKKALIYGVLLDRMKG